MRSIPMVNKLISIFFICFFLIYTHQVCAQDQNIADSLSKIYETKNYKDSTILPLLKDLCYNEVRDNKKALQYANELITLSRQTNSLKYLRAGYFLKGTKLRMLGQLDPALASFITSIELAKQQKNLRAEGDGYSSIADIYSVANNHSTAGFYYRQAIQTLRKSNDSLSLAAALSNAGDDLLKVRIFDTAMQYFSEAKAIYEARDYGSGIGYSLGNIGVVYANTGNLYEAEKNIGQAISILEENHDYYPICDYLISFSDVYEEKGRIQDAIQYAARSLSLAQQYNLNEQVANASKKLSSLYEKNNNLKESLHFYKMYVQYRDSLNNLETVQKMADLRTGFEVSQKQGEVNILTSQKLTQRNLLIASVLIAALALGIIVVLIKSNRHKKQSFIVLTAQKKQTEIEKTKAETALSELTKTQKQLVQSAKLASLGELTAGIAHEIQNPLNFINNFSELNTELINEATQEIENGNVDALKLLLADITDNEQKINQHGKRADAIVKGMLQHSRSSGGVKEPTDINALFDEYLRLSYHGLRARDKSFNATIKTDFDASIGKLTVLPQELGRVILNLLTNAFYVVDEKNKEKSKHTKEGINISGEKYEPTVTIATHKIPSADGGGAEIIITDNGNGIPEQILDKIFQPFFTTKPTGQGTGLGLSMSYDIITKGHGGELKVETEIGKGTKFIITLPG